MKYLAIVILLASTSAAFADQDPTCVNACKLSVQACTGGVPTGESCSSLSSRCLRQCEVNRPAPSGRSGIVR
jgi:hypothetical protein